MNLVIMLYIQRSYFERTYDRSTNIGFFLLCKKKVVASIFYTYVNSSSKAVFDIFLYNLHYNLNNRVIFIVLNY